jgi:[acyl-carrier-protein] S-malonyltransferase
LENTHGLAFLFPGQGSQYVGMGSSLFESHASVRALFERASAIMEVDLATLCFEGPASTLVRTDVAQPAVTLVSLAALQALREDGVEPAVVAGHSVGEYAALCAAGALSFDDTMRVVGVRGRAMQAAAERHSGTMAAVLGLGVDVLESVCEQVGAAAVQIANLNGPTQVVLTGTVEGVREASTVAKARGAKLVVPLKVSGPWHSRFMVEAQEPLRLALEQCEIRAPGVEVIANITAAPYPQDPRALRQLLVDQLVSPVLWAQSMGRLTDAGYRRFVEVGPGRVLSGLMKDISREAVAMNVQDLDTLQKFRAANVSPAS